MHTLKTFLNILVFICYHTLGADFAGSRIVMGRNAALMAIKDH